MPSADGTSDEPAAMHTVGGVSLAGHLFGAGEPRGRRTGGESQLPIGAQGSAAIFTGGGRFAALRRIGLRMYS